MKKFDDNPQPTLLQELGFIQVSEMQGGVYHVKNNPTDGTTPIEYIALMYSPVPIAPGTLSLQLFTLPIPAPLPKDVTPLQMQVHFQNLDARRLEESGLFPINVELPTGIQYDKLKPIEYIRPRETWRIRHCIQLPTGDVVCYN
jgi:hypothetical protein